jgi:hypothetical protein
MAVKEIQMDKPLPYTTKSGLQIGCNYVRPQHSQMSHDAELLQMALLDVEPEFSQRRVVGFIAYVLFFALLVLAICTVGV